MKKKKVFGYIVIILALLFLLGLGINSFMTYRLESYLRERLAGEVSTLTDGFYTCSFDKLSVGFFNGELLVENVELKPDSAIFERWEAVDSIPTTYLDIKIGSIEFKGINLTWKRNYNELHFELFEIISPDVKIYQAFDTRNRQATKAQLSQKTLYELVSPIFNQISVKKMNLMNASFSFFTENEGKSSVYSLSDVNFFAYNFLLDENSSKNGKLLYSENFEFNVN